MAPRKFSDANWKSTKHGSTFSRRLCLQIKIYYGKNISRRLGPDPSAHPSRRNITKPSQTTTILFFTLLLTSGFLEAIQIQTQEENVGLLNDASPLKNHTGCHQFTYHSWTYHQGIHTLLPINFYISLMNYSNPPSAPKVNCFFFIFQH